MIRKLLERQSPHAHVQFIQYGFVAGASFVVDFGLLFVLTHYVHLFYLLSATVSFLVSLVLNYYLSMLWVFSKSRYRRSVEVTVFTVIGLVGLVLNLVIIGVCTSVFGLYYLLSKLVAICIVFFWSFAARRYFFTRSQRTARD